MENKINLESTAAANLTALNQKVDHLLSLDKICRKDIDGMSRLERQYLAEHCTNKLERLKGAERDSFLEKIGLIITDSTNSGIWEQNHTEISRVIAKYMSANGVMPKKSTIAEETGLSRQTIAKHLKEYKQHPDFTDEIEQFKFMAPRVLANLFKFALKGDVRAARLYFEMIGAISKRQNNSVVNEQNNFIQINNTILSQENLKRLSAAQLKQIEEIVTMGGDVAMR